MARPKLAIAALTASFVLIATEAVLACSLADSTTADEIVGESIFALRTYHPFAVLVTLGIALIVYMRRGKGWYFLILPCILLAISPGWFPFINAGIGAGCEPRVAFEMKVILALTTISFVGQLISWIHLRRLKLN